MIDCRDIRRIGKIVKTESLEFLDIENIWEVTEAYLWKSEPRSHSKKARTSNFWLDSELQLHKFNSGLFQTLFSYNSWV